MRAYAILMMLQGHFIYTLLADEYRDTASAWYNSWAFMRGMTAPIFFFASGLIFVFLLLKDRRPFLENRRVKKGLRRAAQLILIGYLLRLCFPQLLLGHFSPDLLSVDVLHCIGLALLSLIGLFGLSHYTRLPFPLLLLTGAGMAFFFYFDVINADWSLLPLALENYLTRANGSAFTPVPWVGYTLLGGVLGYTLHHRPQWAFGYGLPAGLLIFGLLAHAYSSDWLMDLYRWTGVEQFKQHAYFNFLLKRLGHVFVVTALFVWLAQAWRAVPKLLLRVGSETLLIYEVHYIVLYSSWFGIGLSRFWAHALSPAAAIVGALLFVASFLLLIAYIDPVRAFAKSKQERVLRLARLWLYRRRRAWAIHVK
ncbi:MAG: DUF1624 domain-containing protein [Bacteroidetes bacterium]|jgi:hypothetical protein|nr:DUF1624 domain-containing protein [Bacteroidota bacterium]